MLYSFFIINGSLISIKGVLFSQILSYKWQIYFSMTTFFLSAAFISVVVVNLSLFPAPKKATKQTGGKRNISFNSSVLKPIFVEL